MLWWLVGLWLLPPVLALFAFLFILLRGVNKRSEAGPCQRMPPSTGNVTDSSAVTYSAALQFGADSELRAAQTPLTK
jgi:hypothetical protein